jgi:hypothetical protein
MSTAGPQDIKDMAEDQGINLDNTLNERGSRYGTFQGHATVSQMYKNMTVAFLQERKKYLQNDQQEALDMIFHKIARIINGDPNYADSWVDIAGYAKLVADRLEGKVR